MNRIEEASIPLSPSLETDINNACQYLDTLKALERVEVVQRIFTPDLWERPGWALASAPFISVNGSTIPDEVTEHATRLVREVLERGTLPSLNAYEAIQALGHSMPHYKRTATRTIAAMGIAATVACGVFGPPFLSAVVGVSAMMYVRHLARKPDLHGAFATGCLLEATDANRVMHHGDTIPTLMSTVQAYFKDPDILLSFQNPIQSEGFLAARILRIFGYSNVDIFSMFIEPDAFGKDGSTVLTLIGVTLRSQEITLEEPLTTIFENTTIGCNSTTIDLFEDLNAAHFMWAFRDKDKIRHEVASMLLEKAASGGTQ